MGVELGEGGSDRFSTTGEPLYPLSIYGSLKYTEQLKCTCMAACEQQSYAAEFLYKLGCCSNDVPTRLSLTSLVRISIPKALVGKKIHFTIVIAIYYIIIIIYSNCHVQSVTH